jgi:hypothetical protein
MSSRGASIDVFFFSICVGVLQTLYTTPYLSFYLGPQYIIVEDYVYVTHQNITSTSPSQFIYQKLTLTEAALHVGNTKSRK